MMEKTIKWGIMGPGGIARSFAADLLETPGAELAAVASRSKERADAFAQEFGAARSYDSYEAFVQDEEVDIVYIGTLHPAHKEGMLLCLRAGKAVLCEKPFTMNAQEAEEVVQAAREHNTFIMEAMWTRYLPAIVQTRAWIEEGRIGEVKMVTAEFGFDIGWAPENRLLNKKLGGGALLDAGIYPISFASMIFGQQPSRIMSSAHIGETGVDERFTALFEYEGGQTAQLSASVRLRTANNAFIYGTAGYIHVPNFLFASSASLHTDAEEPLVFTDNRKLNGYIFEAQEAMRCLREGRKESAVMPAAETCDIMRTLDRLREQWGLEYTD
ncbi:gfo/Idh/MocA family oxidoreductase [Paenibacillus sambharensis]|uniref:Gfo/Idh/MocA family oxidoreductase n=1 Tax=Paenibacillus sambharensis TaxID=1803190 RepID=A0A2W1LQF7_9BACL|nr:Gfo/Idh/MocA family oxidoreductase [Paenibacillus sambharensis]PZD96744.1 gfo/Idh/MocA family oxidoreductase [Paenibacillus sambharensis]